MTMHPFKSIFLRELGYEEMPVSICRRVACTDHIIRVKSLQAIVPEPVLKLYIALHHKTLTSRLCNINISRARGRLVDVNIVECTVSYEGTLLQFPVPSRPAYTIVENQIVCLVDVDHDKLSRLCSI